MQILQKITYTEDFWSIHYFNLFCKTGVNHHKALPCITSLKLSSKYKVNTGIFLDQFINKVFFSRMFLCLRSGFTEKRGKRNGFNLYYQAQFPSLFYCFFQLCLNRNTHNSPFLIYFPNLSINIRNISAFSISKYYYTYNDSDWLANIRLNFQFHPNKLLPLATISLFKFYQKE